MIDLGALIRVPCVELEMGFAISPDGQRLAYSWNPDGHWEIFELSIRLDRDLSDPVNSQPKQVFARTGGKFNPRYSPNGQHLAYVVDFDGSEDFHIFLLDFATSEQSDLTLNVSGGLQASFAWSPDGSQIAFISDLTGQFNVYVLSVADRKSKSNTGCRLSGLEGELVAGWPTVGGGG